MRGSLAKGAAKLRAETVHERIGPAAEAAITVAMAASLGKGIAATAGGGT
jgi:hypothetical protein